MSTLRKGWMKEVVSNPFRDSVTTNLAVRRAWSDRADFREGDSTCFGHFFDNVQKKNVVVQFRFVSVRPVFVFRAVPSSVITPKVLEGTESTAQRANSSYGSYVIPVHFIPWGK